MKRESNLHRDHRLRLKRRFLKEGLSHFEQHNILELLLFYAIPRQDTNELAHVLLDRFGSLDGVLDASYESLMEVPGVSEHTATLLHLMPELLRVYNTEKNRRDQAPRLSDVASYLETLFEGERRELVYALYFDNRENMIRCDAIYAGDVAISTLMVRKLAENCIALHASFFVLAHNHPNGDIEPSQSDLYTTGMLRDVFSKLQIPLAEHYIYANGRCYPLIERYHRSRLEKHLP